MKTKLLALPFVLAAFVGATPAHAQGIRVCTLSDDTALGGTHRNKITFSRLSQTAGTWSWHFEERDCIGETGWLPSGTLTGTYAGDPCTAVVLTGQAAGAMTGAVTGIGAGETVAGPGTGYILIESTHVLSWAANCLSATMDTVQLHVV